MVSDAACEAGRGRRVSLIVTETTARRFSTAQTNLIRLDIICALAAPDAISHIGDIGAGGIISSDADMEKLHQAKTGGH